jgi:hypothetical protein
MGGFIPALIAKKIIDQNFVVEIENLRFGHEDKFKKTGVFFIQNRYLI